MWLAIETTEDGEVLHGVDNDLKSLETRVLEAIARTVLDAGVSLEDRHRIAELVRDALNHGFTMSEAVTHAEEVVLGTPRRTRIYKTIRSRIARVAYTQE